MSIEDSLKVIRLEGDLRGATARIMQLRMYLASSLCGICGDPLGDDDEDIVYNAQEITVHKKCNEQKNLEIEEQDS